MDSFGSKMKSRTNGYGKRKKETFMQIIFFMAAIVSILSVFLICYFLFVNGLPAMFQIGPLNFLLGREWRPTDIPASYGILPMVLGSVYVMAGAILMGVPIGIMTSVFLVHYCPKGWYRWIKSAVELMAGIPSVVYGFFGLVVLVPFVKNIFGGTGNSMLTASILLGIMILPTIIGVAESAIRSVQANYYEGALALGATHERSVFFIVIPAAKSGILAGVILGVGRAIGETMAVIMVAGNQARMPRGLLRGVRTLTANIVTEMGYATGLHRETLISTALVLFVFILLLNLLFSLLNNKK